MQHKMHHKKICLVKESFFSKSSFFLSDTPIWINTVEYLSISVNLEFILKKIWEFFGTEFFVK